jgi:Tol biopolymer transport system component
MRLILAVALALALAAGSNLPAAAYERTFPETGQTVRDAFLDFFDANGGVELFGYPRTGEFTEGGRYVQYFQRARFEYWPENPPGQQVQLGNLGLDLGRARPPSVQSSDPGRRWFQETQHSIGGGFRDFWEGRGGAAIFGLPISDELTENGFSVQYFQKARFEWHGENPAPLRVQLGLLGDEMLALGKARPPSEAAPRAPIGMPISPSAGGLGKLLVSTGLGGDFYLMDPNGLNAVRVGRGVDPSISRDGNKIAFSIWEDPNPGVYTMDADGGTPNLVYQGKDTRGAVFSPDNSQIAFWEKYSCLRIVRRQNLPDDCYRIKVIPASGAKDGQDWLPPGQSGYATSPSWSPDGGRLLFKDEKAIYVVSRNVDARQVSKFEPRYYLPAWSPLGGKIAVQFDQNRDHYEIGVLPDNGRVDMALMTQSPPFQSPPVTALSPAWSPDGARIAFASDRDGALHIWTMNADGSNPVKISDLPIQSANVLERFVSWGGGPIAAPPTGQAPPPATPAPTPTPVGQSVQPLRPVGG